MTRELTASSRVPHRPLKVGVYHRFTVSVAWVFGFEPMIRPSLLSPVLPSHSSPSCALSLARNAISYTLLSWFNSKARFTHDTVPSTSMCVYSILAVRDDFVTCSWAVGALPRRAVTPRFSSRARAASTEWSRTQSPTSRSGGSPSSIRPRPGWRPPVRARCPARTSSCSRRGSL